MLVHSLAGMMAGMMAERMVDLWAALTLEVKVLSLDALGVAWLVACLDE